MLATSLAQYPSKKGGTPMTKLVETIVEICARCGLPVQGDGQSKSCPCGFTQRLDHKIPEPLDSNDWSDVTWRRFRLISARQNAPRISLTGEENLVQTLAAYIIFLLVAVAVGLGIIFSTILGLVTYEGIAWMKTRPKFRLWEHSVIDAFVRARPRIENEFAILGRAIRVHLGHANQWMRQALWKGESASMFCDVTFSLLPHLSYLSMKKLPRISPLTLVRQREPFDHPGWIFELKHDGFRVLAYINEGGCRLVSRRDNTFKSFNPLREALRNLSVKNAILDGEIVCLDAQGNSLFNELLFRRGRPYFYAFDLIWLNGHDLRNLRLLERKERLKKLILRRTNRLCCMPMTRMATA
jgi:hypothetical protein